jgi:hypothetical protein
MSLFCKEKNSGIMYRLYHSRHRVRQSLRALRDPRGSSLPLPGPLQGSLKIHRSRALITELISFWRGSILAGFAFAIMLAGLLVPGIAHGQQPGETKIPKISKIRGGSTQQAFTGKVQSVDAKHKVLNVKAEEGAGAEIFPIKKNVVLKSAGGEKLALGDLKPGSDVVIYYELKGGQRAVKQIILLSPKSKAGKKESSPPS